MQDWTGTYNQKSDVPCTGPLPTLLPRAPLPPPLHIRPPTHPTHPPRLFHVRQGPATDATESTSRCQFRYVKHGNKSGHARSVIVLQIIKQTEHQVRSPRLRPACPTYVCTQHRRRRAGLQDSHVQEVTCVIWRDVSRVVCFVMSAPVVACRAPCCLWQQEGVCENDSIL